MYFLSKLGQYKAIDLIACSVVYAYIPSIVFITLLSIMSWLSRSLGMFFISSVVCVSGFHPSSVLLYVDLYKLMQLHSSKHVTPVVKLAETCSCNTLVLQVVQALNLSLDKHA
jgi:hypothetical protein